MDNKVKMIAHQKMPSRSDIASALREKAGRGLWDQEFMRPIVSQIVEAVEQLFLRYTRPHPDADELARLQKIAELKNLTETKTAVKVQRKVNNIRCPNCRSGSLRNNYVYYNFCAMCGVKLIWTNEPVRNIAVNRPGADFRMGVD